MTEKLRNKLICHVRIALGIALVTAFTGCVGHVDGGYYDGGGVYVGGPDFYGYGGGYDRGRDVHGYSQRGAASRGGGGGHEGGGGHGGGGGGHGGGGGGRH